MVHGESDDPHGVRARLLIDVILLYTGRSEWYPRVDMGGSVYFGSW